RDSSIRPGVERRAKLKVLKAGKILLDQSLGDQVVVSPASAQKPRTLVAVSPGAFDEHVAIGDGKRGGTFDPAILLTIPVLNHEDRGEPISIFGRERSRRKLELLHHFGIECARQAEEPIGIVYLDPIHQREILVRRASAHGETRTELLGGRDARESLKRAENVV